MLLAEFGSCEFIARGRRAGGMNSHEFSYGWVWPSLLAAGLEKE